MIGIVGVPVTVTASLVTTVKSRLTPGPDVPEPLGVVRLTLEIVGAVVSIVRVVAAPVKVATRALLPASTMVPLTE